MTEDQLRELIRQTIEEILNPQPRRALVLFTGALLGFEDALDGLAAVAADGVELDYVQTPSAARILDQERIAAVGMTEVSNKLVREHQMLIVPTLTVNIAAKVVHGIGDCLASNLLAEFIMANRPVVAVESAATPDSPEKQGWFPRMPAAYAARLRRNLAELADFGSDHPDKVQQWLQERQPKLITSEHWKLIDTHARTAGEGSGRPRVKVTSVEDLLRIGHG